MKRAQGKSPNDQQHDDVTLEAYIHAARHAYQLLNDVRQDLIVLRGDGVLHMSEEVRHDADVSICGKLTAAQALLAGVVRFHEEGRV